jgi:Mg2+-importing ATPase
MRARLSPSTRVAVPGTYWAEAADTVVARLATTRNGLTTADATARASVYGPNALLRERPLSRWLVLLDQLRSPLLLLLAFAAAVSGLTREWLDSAIILSILAATVGVGYSREYRAQAAVDALRARIHLRTRVVRDGQPTTIRSEALVPGDVVLLSAGSLVPADALVLEAVDFYVSEAVLTGESFPVEKRPGPVAAAAGLGGRRNCVYLGTNIRSGTARCLVVATGRQTAFGGIAHRLTLRPPETEFDRGIRRFGSLLTTAMLVLVLVVFIAHAVQGRPPLATLLFAIALAVGLSPELLPAILSVNLARGARMMAAHGVMVRRLNAIENLGSMDVLCTDKTGTLTEGVVKVEGAYGADGVAAPSVLELAAINAAAGTGLANALDDAILRSLASTSSSSVKIAEVPFDFVRKRVTVVVASGSGVRLIAKGAFQHIIEICTRTSAGPLDAAGRRALGQRYDAWSRDGVRVLAVATRDMASQASYGRADERDMTFAGFVTFLDAPKAGVQEALDGLRQLGVSVKLITGDSALVARHVATLVGMNAARVVTGRELERLHDEALWHAAGVTDVFAEVDPNQKERIILALKKTGHVVGFLGDGVNDAPAMHAADTSLAVEEAVDVAREAADFVLLEHGLEIIRRGIEEGRRTFANTLKYVLTTTSANLGNMVSMAVASLVLPFLPLVASQVLLNNFLSDIPAVGLADDRVDPELVERPRRWDMRFIGSFMIVFGLVSSLFDWVTFGVLRWVFQAPVDVFRTTWFVESLLTELAVALVVRTRRAVWRSRPGSLLLVSTILLSGFTLIIPVLPGADTFGFVPVPAPLTITVIAITVLYVVAAETTKRIFYRAWPA